MSNKNQQIKKSNKSKFILHKNLIQKKSFNQSQQTRYFPVNLNNIKNIPKLQLSSLSPRGIKRLNLSNDQQDIPKDSQIYQMYDKIIKYQNVFKNDQCQQGQICVNIHYKLSKFKIKCRKNMLMKQFFHFVRRQLFKQQIISLKNRNPEYQIKKIIGLKSYKNNFIYDYLLSLQNYPINFLNKMNLKCFYYQKNQNKICLKDFQILKCLGNGGFSRVYAGRLKQNAQIYALKIINKSYIMHKDRISIIESERKILQKLNHPFLVKMQFSFQTKKFFVIVLDYCAGGQLFYYLRKLKKMTQDQAKFYFTQILFGLSYLHQNNIIYRDMKPQNLLIDRDGHIKLTDFGLSKICQKKQKSFSFCGSPQYMAPQMILRTGHSYELDFYCLGALLYELLYGIPPFYSKKSQQIYQSVLKQDLTFPDNRQISNQLKYLLQGLMKKNPKYRIGFIYGYKQILLQPWLGKLKKDYILQKKLTPPYIPNLQEFNFDQNQIKQNQSEFFKQLLNQQNEQVQSNLFQNFYFEKQKTQQQNQLEKYFQNYKFFNSYKSEQEFKKIKKSIKLYQKQVLGSNSKYSNEKLKKLDLKKKINAHNQQQNKILQNETKKLVFNLKGFSMLPLSNKIYNKYNFK